MEDFRRGHRRQQRRRSLCCAALISIIAFSVPAKGSWVDPDTPEKYHTTHALSEGDDRKFKLVFSDEFEQDDRTFHDGNDPRWTAINKNDYTNAALHYYSHDNAKTGKGVLNITTEIKDNYYRAFNETTKKYFTDAKHVQSAMLQSWNKFCFTGGIVEFRAKLPGNPNVGGLWPALWLLGNLARATYVGSSDYLWPWSYNDCNPRERTSQEINACSKVAHYGLEPGRGRGAPEIDLIEAMQGDMTEKLPSTNITRPYQSLSLQIAPGIENDRPILGLTPRKGHWYSGMQYANGNLTLNETRSELNPFFYGVTLVHKPKSYTYQADAVSANTQLNLSHYNHHHLYRVEWEPPNEDGTGGHIKWYTDGQFLFSIEGSNLAITGSEIPSEPMYLLMNTAVASSWGFPAPCPEGCSCDCFECGKPSCACGLPVGYCENFPASFEIDYARVYQAVNDSKHTMGCSPVDRPTDLFIRGHEKRYMESGQSRPLEPIQRGGELCTADSDCGVSEQAGSCSSRGYCVCNDGFTGPSCLAHDAFYPEEWINDTRERMPLSYMYIPNGLIAIIIVILFGFLTSVFISQRAKRQSIRYQKLAQANSTSYQNAGDYALPPKQKSVTYCVVDERLVGS